ncbi:MAG: hypothetical protein HY815_07930 [Candidatus Riflebacteria bacterium]|nr:hypothetical protein [Candidatus Riflebacteria bacterium]
MAKKKGPSDSGSDPKGSGQDLLRDLKSFRKQQLNVSEEDEERWKQEAQSRQPGEEPEEAPPKPEPPKPRKRYRNTKPLALAVLIIGATLVLILSDARHWFGSSPVRQPTPTSAPVVLVAVPTVKPLPPPSLPDTLLLAEGYLVCCSELSWAHERIDAENVRKDPDGRYEWAGLEGPAGVFGSPRAVDPLRRYHQLLAGSSRLARSVPLKELVEFVRKAARPGERLLADSLVTPMDVLSPAQTMLSSPHPEEPAFRLVLLSGLMMLEMGVQQQKAGELLARAAREAPPSDPWPARAYALFAAASGRPEQAIPCLEARHAASPKEELTGYQLAWSYLQARKVPDMMRVLERLDGLPEGRSSRLLRAAAHAADGRWDKAWTLLDALETDSGQDPPSFKARVAALQGQALLARGSSQEAAGRLALEKARRFDRGCTWGDLQLARLLVRLKLPDDAADVYRHYLKWYPHAVQVRTELAQLLLSARFFAAALAEYQLLVTADGPKEGYLRAIVDSAKGLGRPDLATYLGVREKPVAAPSGR